MRQSTIDSWVAHVESSTDYPKWVADLIVDVFKKYGQYISEYCDTTLYVWRESVEFSLEPKVNKRHFPQRSLYNMVKKHNEHFIDGKYWSSDGSCPNTLQFRFKR